MTDSVHDCSLWNNGNTQAFESKYTIGPEIAEDSWHRELVRTHLTKRLDALFPDVHDEVVAAFDEYLDGLDTGTWSQVESSRIYAPTDLS